MSSCDGLGDFVFKQVGKLGMWRRGDVRAPHKPLLLLLALGRLARGHSRLIPFRDIDKPLARLLKDFGPPRNSVHPEYPFWRLQKDKLWEVPDGEGLTAAKGHTEPLRSELLSKNVRGGFPKPIFDFLRHNPDCRVEIVDLILREQFPSSLHEDILAGVGLDLRASPPAKRDSQFRKDVLRAYERRCALCGYDGRIGESDLGLEAAHIKWHQYAGPAEVMNGLALCTIHHKAFDRGAIGVDHDLTSLVSTDLYGSEETMKWFLPLVGAPLRMPTRPEWRPRDEYLSWHLKNVFRKPARS